MKTIITPILMLLTPTFCPRQIGTVLVMFILLSARTVATINLFFEKKSLASANFHVVTGYCLGKWSWVYDQKRSRVHSKKKMQPCGKTLVHTGASLIFEYYYFSSIIWDLPAECYQSFNPCTIILVKVPHLHTWKDTLKHKCMVSGVLVISVISLAL